MGFPSKMISGSEGKGKSCDNCQRVGFTFYCVYRTGNEGQSLELGVITAIPYSIPFGGNCSAWPMKMHGGERTNNSFLCM